MPVARLGSISLDCAEPEPLAQFWAELLGGVVVFSSDDFVAVQLPHVWLSAVRVENYQSPSWPDGDVAQQIHLDLAVENLEEAQAGALSLGARLASMQPSPDRWRVLLDPAGHPFCLTSLIPE
jgi:hypothetical protein